MKPQTPSLIFFEVPSQVPSPVCCQVLRIYCSWWYLLCKLGDRRRSLETNWISQEIVRMRFQRHDERLACSNSQYHSYSDEFWRCPLYFLLFRGTSSYPKGYAFWRQPLLASRGCHLAGLVPIFLHPVEPFWHLGTTLGTILAPRDDPWGPWEQQDGHELVRNKQDFHRFWGDFLTHIY